MSDTDREKQPDPEKEPEKKEPAKEPDPGAEAEKWKQLARKHEARAKENAKAAEKLQQIEDENKSEIQKATDKVTQAEGRAAEAERKALQIEVALDKAPEGMPLGQVRKLAKRLSGTTQDELETDAEELFADFAPSGEEEEEGDTPRRRPKERLKPKPGAAPEAEPDESDPAKLAEQVPRSY